MTPSRSARLVLVLAAVGAALALVAGCAGGGGGVSLPTSPTSGPSTPAAAVATAPAPDCGDPRQSYSPSPSTSIGTIDRIKQRGRLRVAVSADTLLFGFRDPITGQLKGFDIEVAKAVAKAIFGDDSKIDYTVVSYAQRIPALMNDQVDLVADVMTMNCKRWAQINFSSEYYTAGQKFLVRSDSPATSVNDLGGKKVCAANGSTNIDELKKYPALKVTGVDDVSDCMVLFQQGRVVAVTGDDTVLAGFVKQDPYAKVIGDRITDEPYGLGIRKENVDFARFVNSVLDDIRQSRWTQFYDQNVKTASDTGPDPQPPQPLYGR